MGLCTTSWCHSCKKVREFFNRRGVPFSKYDIEIYAEAAIRKQELDSRPGVPLAYIDAQRSLGFDPGAHTQALESGRR